MSYYEWTDVQEEVRMATPSIVSMMGGHRSLGTRVRTTLDMAELIERGLPRSVAERLCERLGLTEAELARCLGVSAKTLQRLAGRRAARLTPVQSDRLYRLARLAAMAEGAFEDLGRAREWLREPQRGLGGRVPLEVMRTEVGAREVEDLLGRIEYGVFS
jgi:putative toxin-antitoxin system antitoxin component (TIGR02293 family)